MMPDRVYVRCVSGPFDREWALAARLSVEGWSLGQLSMDLTGDGARDGLALAETFARILGVPAPPP
jgi:hypothetical protein